MNAQASPAIIAVFLPFSESVLLVSVVYDIGALASASLVVNVRAIHTAVLWQVRVQCVRHLFLALPQGATSIARPMQGGQQPFIEQLTWGITRSSAFCEPHHLRMLRTHCNHRF